MSQLVWEELQTKEGRRVQLDRFLSSPASFIDSLVSALPKELNIEVEANAIAFLKHVSLYFAEAEAQDLDAIPSLDSVPNEMYESLGGKVVRFRGMVQDLYQGDLGRTATRVEDRNTGQEQVKCLLFAEQLELQSHEKEVVDSEVNPALNLTDVETLHLISIPGQNTWVRQSITGRAEIPGMKEEERAALCAFPLKSMLACMSCKVARVRVYRGAGQIKVNEVVEVFGILHLDEKEEQGRTGEASFPGLVDCPSSSPPTSLVPRISALAVVKSELYEIPTVHLTMTQLNHLSLQEDWRQPARDGLVQLLKEMCLGDSLCAQYILMHLMSEVQTRMGGSPVGPLPLAVTSVPVHIARFWRTVLDSLLEKSVYVEEILQSLTTETYIPWKDQERNKLMSGILQLSRGTHLFLEERELTGEEARNLRNDPKGMRNLKAVQDLIEWQTVPYDFTFQSQELEHDVAVLVFATGKTTLFRKTLELPWRPTLPADGDEFERLRLEIEEGLGDVSKMWMYRDLLLHLKKPMEFEISSEMNEEIGKEFSLQRMSTDDLHVSLSLARYALKYKRQTALSPQLWGEVRSMELERKARIVG